MHFPLWTVSGPRCIIRILITHPHLDTISSLSSSFCGELNSAKLLQEKAGQGEEADGSFLPNLYFKDLRLRMRMTKRLY